jgi:hypothetical protein
MLKIRIVRRFVLFTTETIVDNEGNLSTKEHQYHTTFGKIYPIEEFNDEGPNRVSFTFAEGSAYKGTANNVEKSYVELLRDGAGNKHPKTCC